MSGQFHIAGALLLSACLAQAQAPPPAANLPAQRIGALDLVSISTYDAPEFTRTVRVGSDGLLRLPMMTQPIKAGGLMPSELEAAVAHALKAEHLIVDPYVTVTVTEYQSRPISVVGAVKTPLTFQATGPVTLLEAIARAGGLTEQAGSEILVHQVPRTPADGATNSLSQRIPVKELMDQVNPEMNLVLAGGEEVRVPELAKVFIVGNVKRPGAYPVQSSGPTTVLKMLALAEGLSPFASKQAYIYRTEGGPGAQNEIPIELSKIMDRKAKDAPLMANDILYIPDNKGRRLSVNALERILAFGAGTASGALIYGIR